MSVSTFVEWAEACVVAGLFAGLFVLAAIWLWG